MVYNVTENLNHHYNFQQMTEDIVLKWKVNVTLKPDNWHHLDPIKTIPLNKWVIKYIKFMFIYTFKPQCILSYLSFWY